MKIIGKLTLNIEACIFTVRTIRERIEDASVAGLILKSEILECDG